MASISERENREIEAANSSGNTPVDHGWPEVAHTALDFVKRFA